METQPRGQGAKAAASLSLVPVKPSSSCAVRPSPARSSLDSSYRGNRAGRACPESPPPAPRLPLRCPCAAPFPSVSQNQFLL